MNKKKFKAMWVEEVGKNQFTRTITERTTSDLPDGEVLVRVKYSSLNYKDALSATGNRGVTRKFPHTPGIDAAGVVEESTASGIGPGDEVIVTSYDLGNEHIERLWPIYPGAGRMGGQTAGRPEPEGEHGLRDRRIHGRSLPLLPHP